MESGKNIWPHKSRPDTEKLISDLKQALSLDDTEKLIGLLGLAENLRSLVVMRGKQSENLRLFLKCFDHIVTDKTSDLLGFMGASGEQILDIIHKLEIPEQIIAEINDIAYHLRDKEMFSKSFDLVDKHSDKLKNKQLLLRLKHNQATWTGDVLGEFAKAVEMNKDILGAVRESGDRVLEQKVKFGIRIYKIKADEGAIKPGELAKDFEELAKVLDEEGVRYNAAYSRSEAARAYFALAKRQAGDKARANEFILNLKRAKELSLQAVKEAHELAYANLEVVAQELLSDISARLDENRSARRYQEKARNARTDYEYKTEHKHLKN